MILKILQKKQETDQVFSLILEKPAGLHFYPGQYLDVELTNDTRAFTISSSHTEDFLMITTRKGVSPFKKFMENLKTGNTITASHPAGTFTLDESQPAVFIAGGIGITPFRSIFKYVVDQKLQTNITLLYSSKEDFVFKEELDIWIKQTSNLSIIYHNTNQDGRLNKKAFKLYPLPFTLYPIFYLAGSHGFVNAMAQILIDSKVDETNIRYDRFDGY